MKSTFTPVFLLLTLVLVPCPPLAADEGWPACGPFVRGDPNGDDSIDIADPVYVLLHLFLQGAVAPGCMDALDANDDEAIDLSDGVFLVQYLFLDAAAPVPPFPSPGTDEPCNGEDDDGDGSIDEGCHRNEKDLSRYSARAAFLVSDQDWRDVLPLIPTAVWTGEESPCSQGTGTPAGVCAYPTLIVHVEDAVFDPDSILHFLEQYRTDRVYLAGSVPEALRTFLEEDGALQLSPEDLIRISHDDYVSFWQDTSDVVVVEDDYESALLASTFASLINAPLIIEGHEGSFSLSGKRITCVGSPSASCDESYSLDDLQARVLELTSSDKLVLVRPDLDLSRLDVKVTRYSGTVRSLFGKTSLAAAFLAAAKHEILAPVHSWGVDDVVQEVQGIVQRLQWGPQYLTIVASPLEIQHTIQFTRSYGNVVTWCIDNTRYGNTDGDPFGFTERKTGRIYGFTVSDVSTYIARALFHHRIPRPDDYLFIGQGVGATDQRARLLASAFTDTGYSTTCRTYANPAQPVDWTGKVLINNDAHGSPYYSTISIDQIPLFEDTLVFTASCLTCAFDKLTAGSYGRLFCLQLLRNGALGVVASVDTAGFTWDATRLNGALSWDLGTTFKSAQNFDHARNKWYIEDLAQSDDYRDLQADIQFLLGDPTVRVPFERPVLPGTQCEVSQGQDAITMVFRVWSMNVDEQGTAYVFIEGSDDLYQAQYGRFFLKGGPVDLFEVYSVESPDVDPMFFGGLKVVAVQEEADGVYAHFLVEKNLSSRPVHVPVENVIRITISRR